MGIFDGFNKKRDEDFDDIMEVGDAESHLWDDDEDVEPEVEEEAAEETASFAGINESAVSLKIITPKSLGEAEKTADYLIGGSSVVLNIEEIETSDVIRFMDYLQGVLHVIHGNMKQVSKTTFVATPNNVGIDSENGAE
jgi:FtsZ-interacting cell division protein YlmF